MAKTIVIARKSWLERHPVQIRRMLVRLIFSEATEEGWQIHMEGQRWRDNSVPYIRAATIEPHTMTDADWAMLMGPSAA